MVTGTQSPFEMLGYNIILKDVVDFEKQSAFRINIKCVDDENLEITSTATLFIAGILYKNSSAISMLSLLD